MFRNYYKVIGESYEVLKLKEWYWMLDNSYRQKYEHVKEAANDPSTIHHESLEYVADCAEFLVKAYKRIWK